MPTQTLIYETFGYSVWFTPASDEFIHAAANRQNLHGNLAAELARVKRQLTTVPHGLESLAESLCNYLPHGSGIDYDWNIIITPSFIPNTRAQRGRKRKIGYLVTCENDYHGMDHAGGYSGTIGGFVLSFWLDDELQPVSILKRVFDVRNPQVAVNSYILCELEFNLRDTLPINLQSWYQSLAS